MLLPRADGPPQRTFPIYLILVSLWRVINDVTSGFGYETPRHQLRDSYDYIVVGGGSSGCILASRLSEDPDVTVLLLEQGPGQILMQPFAATTLFTHLDPHVLFYKTLPQPYNCKGYENNRCTLLRGGSLGGTTTINFMALLRGTRRDYDEWKELGLYDWGYDGVLPYFKRFENNLDPRFATDVYYHGVGGPATIRTLQYVSDVGKAFMKAAQQNGYEYKDLNGASQTGFMHQQGFFDDGWRVTVADSYLKPILWRKNLHIALNSKVTKILIDDYKRAYGVVAVKDKTKRKYYANREVLVTTGAFETPKLLKLSGIGPASELASHGIPVISDLPVGLDMISRVGVLGIIFSLKSKGPSYDYLDLLMNPKSYFDALFRRKGIWMGGGGYEGFGFMKTDPYLPDDLPDVGILFIANSFAIDFGLVYNNHRLRFKPDVIRELVVTFEKDSFELIPYIIKPRSRGSVLLKSSNPRHHPLIVPNFFENDYDVYKMVQGIKAAIHLGLSPAFQKYGVKFIAPKLPGCRYHEPWGDDYIRCFIRHMTYAIYHDVGTAKMGPPNVPWSVVDPELRVYGVSGLRVVDVSISPTITYGNWAAPAYMIAEKASDIIRSSWRSRSFIQGLFHPPTKTNTTYNINSYTDAIWTYQGQKYSHPSLTKT